MIKLPRVLLTTRPRIVPGAIVADCIACGFWGEDGKLLTPRYPRYGDAFRLLVAILARHPEPVSIAEMVDTLCSNDPEGGPENIEMIVRQMMAGCRRCLLPYSLGLYATSLGFIIDTQPPPPQFTKRSWKWSEERRRNHEQKSANGQPTARPS